MILHTVVLHIDKPCLEAVVEEPVGKLHRVKLEWRAKEPELPANWLELVQQELDLQRQESVAREKGRGL